MDDQRFDALAKGLSTGLTRRSAWRRALGGVLGIAGITASTVDADAQNTRFRSQHCLPNQLVCRPANPRETNTRRGTKHRHPCSSCCSGYSVRAGRQGRRCSCRPDGMRARNRAECCSGRRRARRCVSASPVTSPLFEQGSGTLTSASPPTCSQTGSCTDSLSGTITGSPITGTFTGTAIGSNFQGGPGTTFTADVAASFVLRETATGATLTLVSEAELTQDTVSGDFTTSGSYTIVRGTGRFAGATGSGTAQSSGTDAGQTGTLDSLTLQGTITIP